MGTHEESCYTRSTMPEARNLLETLAEFSEAVEKMNKTILVPRRLMDLPEDDLPKLSPRLHRCAGDKAKGETGAIVEKGQEISNDGLFGVYQMLQQMKEEVLTGRQTEVDGCFRNHMMVIQETLQHLTAVAKQITSQYCKVSGDPASCGGYTSSHRDPRPRSRSAEDLGTTIGFSERRAIYGAGGRKISTGTLILHSG